MILAPGAGADNPLGPKFWYQQEHLITSVTCCKLKEQVAQRATIAHLSPMCQGQILFKKSGDTDVLDTQGQLTP